ELARRNGRDPRGGISVWPGLSRGGAASTRDTSRADGHELRTGGCPCGRYAGICMAADEGDLHGSSDFAARESCVRKNVLPLVRREKQKWSKASSGGTRGLKQQVAVRQRKARQEKRGDDGRTQCRWNGGRDHRASAGSGRATGENGGVAGRAAGGDDRRCGQDRGHGGCNRRCAAA